MALITVDPDAPIETVKRCRRGHPQTEANVRWFPDHKRAGVLRRYCQPCRTEAATRARQRQATLSTLVRSSGEVRTIWSRLPTDFRTRLAGVLISPPPGVDDLQMRILRRAAERQCWYRCDSDVAVRLYVEALIELTLDARSPALRIDRLLAIVLFV